MDEVILKAGHQNDIVVTIRPLEENYKLGDVIKVIVEFENKSTKSLRLFDFQDDTVHSASYLRGMVLGFNQEPRVYHMGSVQIEKIILLNPGEKYRLVQEHDVSGRILAREHVIMTYDTKSIETHWKGDYWKGKIQSNEIVFKAE